MSYFPCFAFKFYTPLLPLSLAPHYWSSFGLSHSSSSLPSSLIGCLRSFLIFIIIHFLPFLIHLQESKDGLKDVMGLWYFRIKDWLGEYSLNSTLMIKRVPGRSFNMRNFNIRGSSLWLTYNIWGGDWGGGSATQLYNVRTTDKVNRVVIYVPNLVRYTECWPTVVRLWLPVWIIVFIVMVTYPILRVANRNNWLKITLDITAIWNTEKNL